MVYLLPALLAMVAGDVVAHDARPVYLELKESQAGLFDVSLKSPGTIGATNLPRVLMPPGCQPVGASRDMAQYGLNVRFSRFQCSDPLVGGEIRLDFPEYNPALSTLVRAEWRNGVIHSAVLPPDGLTWRIPGAASPLALAGQYIRLGIGHILRGIDHLLFVLCLLFIAGTFRRILITITGFTLAHSLTLVLAALGLVVLPVPVVEAVIALSVIFLALEIMKKNPDSWTYRHPVVVAVCFGLLHGFGFASALREAGLPGAELPMALLFFNLGVEAGQLLFITMVAVAAVIWVGAGLRPVFAPEHRRLAGYLVGSVAAFWFIDRTLSFWV